VFDLDLAVVVATDALGRLRPVPFSCLSVDHHHFVNDLQSNLFGPVSRQECGDRN
jgi:hypothetical protein